MQARGVHFIIIFPCEPWESMFAENGTEICDCIPINHGVPPLLKMLRPNFADLIRCLDV